MAKVTNSLVGCVETPKYFPVTNEYLQLLAEYPTLTAPRNGKRQVKHNVCHKIVTKSYPCSARPRPLSPEKLACAQEKINQLLEAGIVRRSDSPTRLPFTWYPNKLRRAAHTDFAVITDNRTK